MVAQQKCQSLYKHTWVKEQAWKNSFSLQACTKFALRADSKSGKDCIWRGWIEIQIELSDQTELALWNSLFLQPNEHSWILWLSWTLKRPLSFRPSLYLMSNFWISLLRRGSCNKEMQETIYTSKTDIRMEIEYFLPLCKFDLDTQSYLSTRNKPFFAWDSPLQRYSKKFKKRVEKKKFTSCIFIATLIYHIRHTISRQKMLRNQKIAWTF